MASFRKLPSGKWQAIVKHPSGKRYTKTDPLKRTLVDWAADVEARIRRGDFVDPKAGRMTLGEWWTRWQSTRTVERNTTLKNTSHWRTHVEPAFGSWPLASIQSWDVETWVAKMRRGDVGAETVQAALRLLRQMLAAAVRHKLIASNAADVVRAPTPPKHVDRFLSLEESQRLLDAITLAKPGHGEGVRDRAPDLVNQLFVRLLLEAGMRWSEAAGLHAFRVDLMRRQLRVVEVLERNGQVKAYPKTSAGQRVVPLTDELVTLLSAHLAGRPREGLVFEGRDGGVLSYSNWRRRVWAPAVERAKLVAPVPTPHDCRHSYGSWLAEQGVPPHEIAALMGHSSLRAVERYVHASEARMERARAALGARGAHDGSVTRKRPVSPSGETGL